MEYATEYVGSRSGGRPTVYRIYANGRSDLLPQRIVYHSPDGFEWGYGGSGPSDLAWNILADYIGWDGTYHFSQPAPTLGTGDRMLPKWTAQYHNDFKFDFLASADPESFNITREQITAWCVERGFLDGDPA